MGGMRQTFTLTTLNGSWSPSVFGVLTLGHCLADGPLHKLTYEELLDRNCCFVVSFFGTDGITKDRVTLTCTYETQDVMFGYKFADQVSSSGNSITTFDLAKTSEIESADVTMPYKLKKPRRAALTNTSDHTL